MVKVTGWAGSHDPGNCGAHSSWQEIPGAPRACNSSPDIPRDNSSRGVGTVGCHSSARLLYPPAAIATTLLNPLGAVIGTLAQPFGLLPHATTRPSAVSARL